MNFSTEELLPVVAELADKYTGKESTSITYETARQLMEAVLYCIHEYEADQKDSHELLASDSRMDAKAVYAMGYDMVLKKVKETKIRYNKMMLDFSSYNNRCCYDTFVKGIPGFFQYYDPRFHPQDHILTLDYPVLISLDSLCGAAAIDRYVRYAGLEQSFLRKLPEAYILHVLEAYDSDYGDLFINLAGIVLRNILGCRIAGKAVLMGGYTQKERKRLTEYVNQLDEETLEQSMRGMIDELIQIGYDGNGELGDYLKADMHNFSFELKNAVKNQCLESVLAVGNKKQGGSIFPPLQ